MKQSRFVNESALRERAALVEQQTERMSSEAVSLITPRRWGLADWDGWLWGRLNALSLASEQTWRGKLAGLASHNDFYFVTNDAAVLLAYFMRDPVSNDVFVMERFAFARGANNALVPLYLHLRQWAKDKGASRIYVGICSDMLIDDITEFLDGAVVMEAKC